MTSYRSASTRAWARRPLPGIAAMFLLAAVSALQPALAQTVPGNAIRFNGSDAYIEVPNDASLQIPDVVTLTAWVKRTRDAIDIIMERGGDWNYGRTNYGLGLHTINNQMLYFFYQGGWRGTDGVADLDWHHYAVVARHGDPQPTFYIDGVERPTQYAGGSGTINLCSTATEALHIGAQVYGAFSYFSANVIDEVGVWNRALSAAQIQAAIVDTLGPQYYSAPDSGLVGYWRFNELENLGVGGDGADDVRDLTTFGHHGDLVGGGAMVASGAFWPGACCRQDGVCVYTTEHHCSAPSAWLGAGFPCAPHPCPPPEGACCLEGNTCEIRPLPDCYPGVWQGVYTTCDPNPCPNTSGAGEGGESVHPVTLRFVSSPGAPRVALDCTLPEMSRATLDVFDLSGRMVHRFAMIGRDGGTYRITWDGRDDAGHRVPSGVYLARLETSAGTATCSVMLVR